MSIDAIAYIKTLNVVETGPRFLLYVIAENTFNDTGLCRVGKSVLVEDTKMSERTVRRHLEKLENSGVIRKLARPKSVGGRSPDDYELIGFKDWLRAVRKPKAETAKLTGSGGATKKAETAKLSKPKRPLLAVSIKTRTSKNRTSEVKGSAKEKISIPNTLHFLEPARRSEVQGIGVKNDFEVKGKNLDFDGLLTTLRERVSA